jgi:hypothetical protein
MDVSNYQLDIHEDLWKCIFTFCNEYIVVLKLVSKNIDKYVISWLRLNGFRKTRLGLGDVGTIYGYPEIIKLAFAQLGVIILG